MRLERSEAPGRLSADHHLAAVFAKLGVDSRLGAIQAAQRAGLRARPAADSA